MKKTKDGRPVDHRPRHPSTARYCAALSQRGRFANLTTSPCAKGEDTIGYNCCMAAVGGSGYRTTTTETGGSKRLNSEPLWRILVEGAHSHASFNFRRG